VSVLELPARWGRIDDALDEVDELLSSSDTSVGRPDLAVLPEMSLVGYVSPHGDFDPTRFAEPIDGPTMGAVGALARRHAVHLVAPLVLSEGDCVYNASIALGPDGGVLATYRKRHPWFPETWATPGPLPPPLVRMGGLTVTLAICYDGHFLAEDSAEELSRADLLVFTSAWVDEEDSRVPLLRSLSRRFGVSVANANWGPGVVSIAGQGGSCILDGNAHVIASVQRGGRRADAVVRPRARR
jgi:predicted amidohydrolase